MGKIYVFYADVFWLNNALINAVVLTLTMELCGAGGYKKRLRGIAAGAAGAALQTFALVLSRSAQGYQITSLTVFWPLMIFASFGRSGIRAFIRRMLLALVMVFLTGGMLGFLEQRFGITRITAGPAAVLWLAGSAFVRLLVKRIRIRRLLYPVTLSLGEKSVECIGFLDTGNRLKMPAGGYPVHVVSRKILKELSTQEPRKMIPYSGVGVFGGMLPVYKVYLRTDAGHKRAEPAWVAVAEDALFLQKPYQMILNGEMINEMDGGEESGDKKMLDTSHT